MKFFVEAYHRPSQECGLPDFNVLNRVFDRFPAIHGGKNLPPMAPRHCRTAQPALFRDRLIGLDSAEARLAKFRQHP